MTETNNLYKNIEEFINNHLSTIKNKPFKINYHPNSSNNIIPYLYDNTNYIQCLIKDKDKDNLNKKQKDLKLLINKSSFEFILYKNDNNLNIIKCLLLIIVNDYSIIKEEPNKFEENNLIDINKEENILDKLQLFLFYFIKDNKDKNKDLTLEKILLGDSSNNIRFFNNTENTDFINDIKKCESQIEINCKENINDILDELNPDYKEELMNQYIDEMPEEIVNLMKKYKNINFTNDMYLNYINYKNNAKENENKEKKDVDGNINKDDNEENNNIKTPNKKGKENNNENISNGKKQIFKIK